ncbi:GGDEF domain-containing protein [Deinococcus sp. YIM 134068]|uniref:GGDEF domain-containing protein n=1 Tax=Deinococcus lichenicola TaxID=3118910 RepID=UPI002F9408E2
MRSATANEVKVAPEEEFRRHALLSLLGCVAVVSVLSLGASSSWSFTNGTWEDIGLTFLTVKSVVLFGWLWWWPAHFRVVGLVELLTKGVTGAYKFGVTLLDEHTAQGLGGYTFWLILYYIVASLVLRGRQAVVASLALFAVLLVQGGLYWFAGDVPAHLKATYGNTLAQMYLMHATLIAFLALQGRLLGQLVQAVRKAEGEARFAHVDALTELPNRRQLEVWLAEHQSQVVGAPLSVILFDLDHFKRVNDTHGHDAGDRVLRAVAGAARPALRPHDRLGRWGGEEFLVLLPGTPGPEARAVAECLQAALSAFHHTGVGRVTVSCGVAQALPGETTGDLLKRADEALYEAKRNGRALVRVAV